MNYIAKFFNLSSKVLRRKLSSLSKVKLSEELLGNVPRMKPVFPNAFFRGLMNSSRETADKIYNHEFDILGTGLKKLGKDIDWTNPFGEVNNEKLTWELSRFQFLPSLVKVYEIYNEEKYSAEAKSLIRDWILKNPFAKGVNWKCTMDVSIRACNFAFAWYFLKNSKSWKETGFQNTFLTTIVEHGKFILRNLEYGAGFNSNHLIANAVGLLFLGILFPQFKEARKWKAKAIAILESEMKRQVYEDGVNYEASIPYHRLVAELFGFSALLCEENEIRFSPEFTDKLEKMFNFVRFYTKPSGLSPQIGDSDDGRLFIFEDFFSWDPFDHRHLFHLANRLFPGNPHFNADETKAVSRGFNLGGIYIMRKDDFCCIVDCGSNGQAGNAGHAHNDTLSFELSVGGQDFIIDSGTYVYTSDPVNRNKFRGTRMHNTVMIDNEEMNRFRKYTVFSMHNDAIPSLNRWDSDEKHDFLDAQHNGYKRFRKPALHRRTFSFDKKNLILEIKDYFSGKGAHNIEWNFHFDTEVSLIQNENTIMAQKNNICMQMILPQELARNAEIREDEVSHRFGVKNKAKVITIKLKIDLRNSQTFGFEFRPC